MVSTLPPTIDKSKIRPDDTVLDGRAAFRGLSSYSQLCQAQTPTQRRANEKHAKSVEKRMGKPETSFKKKETKKSPVGIAAVGTFSTYLRPPVHLFTCPLPTSSFFLFSLTLRSSSSSPFLLALLTLLLPSQLKIDERNSPPHLRDHRATLDRAIQTSPTGLGVHHESIGQGWLGVEMKNT
jgi:hypothetical protein